MSSTNKQSESVVEHATTGLDVILADRDEWKRRCAAAEATVTSLTKEREHILALVDVVTSKRAASADSMLALLRVVRQAVEEIERGNANEARRVLIEMHAMVLIADPENWTPEDRARIDQHGRELADAIALKGAR